MCLYGPFVPGYVSFFWEDADRQLRAIHKYRDATTARVYHLHYHYVDGQGCAKGSLWCNVPAGLLADPQAILARAGELWKLRGAWNLALLHAQDDTRELHFSIEEIHGHSSPSAILANLFVWDGRKLRERYMCEQSVPAQTTPLS